LFVSSFVNSRLCSAHHPSSLTITAGNLWIPATFVNMAFVPPELRVLFINALFYFWTIYLSLTLGGDGKAGVGGLCAGSCVGSTDAVSGLGVGNGGVYDSVYGGGSVYDSVRGGAEGGALLVQSMLPTYGGVLVDTSMIASCATPLLATLVEDV
jgi:Mpv17 / PMP22 family